MDDLKTRIGEICLDEHGRAVLSDEMMDALSQHDLYIPLAGGTNPNCNNNACSNTNCNSSSQTNSSCTNTNCSGPMNSNCVNRRDMDGG